MAHYLGLENIRNHFLGTSIFERNLNVREAMSIASVGQDETFLIDKSGIYRHKDSHQHQKRLLVLNKFIEITRNLEKGNRLWDGNTTP